MALSIGMDGLYCLNQRPIFRGAVEEELQRRPVAHNFRPLGKERSSEAQKPLDRHHLMWLIVYWVSRQKKLVQKQTFSKLNCPSL